MANDLLNELASVGKSATKTVSDNLNSINQIANQVRNTNLNSNMSDYPDLPDPSTLSNPQEVQAFNNALSIRQQLQADDDFGEISTQDYINKYGEDAYYSRMNRARELGEQGGIGFKNPVRESIADPALGVAQGIATGALGLVGLVNMVADPTGTANAVTGEISEAINNFADSLKTRNLRSTKYFDNAEAEQDYLKNKYQEQVNVANGANPNTELVKRILKDAGSYIGSRSLSSLKDDLAQGIGFVYPSTWAARGLATVGKLVGKTVSGTTKGARIGESIGGSTMLNSGIGYGGASANNVAYQIDSMSADEVLATSPLAQEKYKEYLDQGYSPNEAKELAKSDVRGKTSRKAGLLSGIIAAVPSAGLSQRYIRNPFTKATGKEALYSVAENTLQGNVTLGENIAKKENLNPNQDLGEGVGANVGLGFTSSLSTAAGGGAKALARNYGNHLQLKELDENYDKKIKPISDFIKSKTFAEDSNLTTEQKQEINALRSSLVDNNINKKYGLQKDTDFLTGLNSLKRKALEANTTLDDNGKVLKAQTDLLDYYAEYGSKIQDLKDDNKLSNTKEGQEYKKALELANKDKYIQNAQNVLAQRVNTMFKEDLLDDASKAEKEAVKYTSLYNPLRTDRKVLDYAEKNLNLNEEEKTILDENRASIEFLNKLNEIDKDSKVQQTRILNKFINTQLQNILNNRKVLSNSSKEQTKYIDSILNNFNTTVMNRLSASLAADLFGTKETLADTLINSPVTENLDESQIKEEVLREAITSGSNAEELTSNLNKLKELFIFNSKVGEQSEATSNTINYFNKLIDTIIKNPKNTSAKFELLSRISGAGNKLVSDLLNPSQSNHNIDLNSFIQNPNLRAQILPEYFNIIKDSEAQPQTEQNTSETTQQPTGQTAQQTTEQTTEPVQETSEQAVEEESKTMAQKAVDTAKNVASKTANTVKKAVNKVMPSKKEEQAQKSQETENTVSPESRTDKGSPVENNTSEPEVNTQEVQEDVETKLQTEEPTQKQEQISQEQNTEQAKEAKSEKKVINKATRNFTQVELPNTKLSDLRDDTPLINFEITGPETQYSNLGELRQAEQNGKVSISSKEIYRLNPVTNEITPTTVITYAERVENSKEDPELVTTENSTEYVENAFEEADLSAKEELVEDSKMSPIDKEVVNNAYSMVRTTSIINAFGSQEALGTEFGKNVTEKLTRLGEFENQEKIENFNIPDSLSSIFDFSTDGTLINKFAPVLENFMDSFANNEEELNKIINGTSTLPLALQMLFRPYLGKDGKYALKHNSNMEMRVVLAMMDSAINNMELPSSEANIDIANNVGANLEDVMKAEKIVDGVGNVIAYSGKDFLSLGSKNVSLDNYQNYLARKLQDFLGYRPTNDTNLKEADDFFKQMAIELIDIMNQNKLLHINRYNLGSDNFVERVNFNKSLKNSINATLRIDEDNLDVSDEYKAELPKTIVQDFFLDKTYTDSMRSIGKIGEIKFTDRTESIMPYTSKESQKWLNNINRISYLVNPIMANTINDDSGIAFWCAMADAGLQTRVPDKDFRRSIKGKQLNIKLAIQRANEIIADMKEYAAKNGIPLSEVAKYYEHRIISNGRAQEMEAFGPTVDKLVREILSPTKAIVDLTNEKQLTLYKYAIAQALGVNLGTTEPTDITSKVDNAISNLQDILNNPEQDYLHPLISVIRDLNNGKSFEQALTDKLDPRAAANLSKRLIKSLGEGFGYESPASFRALCSLINYMDTANSNPEKLKNMEVFDWIEVDGTNHGPAHTQTEYSLDYENVVPVLASVGMYVGTTDVNHASRAKITNANSKLQEALDKDLYTTNLRYSDENFTDINENLNRIANRDKGVSNTFFSIVVDKLTGKNDIHDLQTLIKTASDNGYVDATATIDSINYFLGITAADPTAKFHLTYTNGKISLSRSWMKPWTMQGGYLSGLNGLTRGAMHVINRGFSKLRNNILNNLNYYSLQEINAQRKANNPNAKDITLTDMLNGLAENKLSDKDKEIFGKAIYAAINNVTDSKAVSGIDYVNEFNKFITNLNNIANIQLGSIDLNNNDQNSYNEKSSYLYGIDSKQNINLGVNLLKFGWGYFKSSEGSKVYNTIFNNVKTYAMKPISKANDRLLRENSNLITTEINNISSGVAASYNRVLLDNIQTMIEDGTFTLGNLKKLYKDIKGINNVYTTEEDFINFTLGSQNNIPLTNNKLDTGKRTRKTRQNKFEIGENNTEGENTYTSLSGRTYTYSDTFSGSRMPGVAAVPISTQTNSDVSMSHDVIRDATEQLQRPVHATLCHDGIHCSLDDMNLISSLANNSALRTFLQNPLISFYKKLGNLINFYKNPESSIAISTRNLFDRVNSAIKNEDFSNVSDQELADYLDILKQFIRHSNEGNKSVTDFGISHSYQGITNFLSELTTKIDAAKDSTVKAKYQRLFDIYNKLSRENGTTIGVTDATKTKVTDVNQADFKKDGIKSIFFSPRTNIENVRRDPSSFPIKWEITYDDLLTLADDFYENLGNQVDMIDCLHQAMQDFGIVAHHFAGNNTGISMINASEEVQNRVNELKAQNNLSDTPVSKEDFRKIGYVINTYATELYNNRNKDFSRSSIKSQIIESNNVKTFIDTLSTGINNKNNNNLNTNVATDIPTYDLTKLIITSKGLRGNSIPKIVIAESANTDILIDKERYIYYTMYSSDKGAYIFDSELNDNFGYIVVNKAAINDYCNLTKEDPDTEIKRTISHELIHGTVGESVNTVLQNWAKRGSIEPRSQEEHLVANLLSAVYVALKTVKVNSKNISRNEDLKKFLSKNFGLSFGGNFLFSLLSNQTETENNPYLSSKELLDKFNDDSYTRVAFIRDLVNSNNGVAFADEAITFLSNCSKEEFKNIDNQVNKALTNKEIAKENANFIKHTIRTLHNLSNKVISLLKNLFLLHSRISPTKNNIEDIEAGIKDSFSNGVMANVTSLVHLRVRSGNAITQTGTQIRYDSFINNDGTFNNNFEYSIPQYSADTPTTNIAEFLNKSYTELSKAYKENAYKYVANAVEIAKAIDEENNGYLTRFPKINEKIPSRFINIINKSVASHIANERSAKAIDTYKDLAVNSGFLDTQDKRNMFDNIFRSIAMHGAQNNQNYNRLSQLREYILTHMSYEDFLEDKDNASIQDVTEAQRKFDTLSGKLLQGNKEFSQALFYSLVCLDSDLQNKLIKMDIPNIYKTSKGDNILDKAIIGTLDSISEFTTKALASKKLVNKQNNLRDSVFTLLTAFNDRYISEKLNLEATSIVGDSVQSINNLMINGIGGVFNYYNQRYRLLKRSDGSNQPLNYFDTNFGSEIGENVTEFVNKHSNLAIVNDLIKDIVGSTQTTYPIYQVIKQAHAEVQQTRQIYREQIPAEIMKKFKKRYKASEYARMTNCIEAVDLSCLNNLGYDVMKSLVTTKSPQILNNHIQSNENLLRAKMSQAEFTKVKRDALNLAHYMASENKEYSFGFKYNPYAILVDAIGIKRLEAEPDLENTLDQLISLYALNEFKNDSSRTKEYKFLSKLLENEKDGMNQILSTLNTQFKEQNNSTKETRVRANAVKGYLGNDSRDSTHIIIESNKPEIKAELERRGYTYLKDYSTGNKGYYLSSLPNRSMFIQGGIQDIHYCVNGVNVNGYRINTTAERIYDPKEVHKLLGTEYLNSSKTKYATERLVPIYDVDSKSGKLKITGFERTVDATTMKKARPQRHIAILAGITAGRMQERKAASNMNKQLIQRTYDMWRNARDKSQYVNLFNYYTTDRTPEGYRKTKDAVIADALSNIPVDLLNQINEIFNSDENRKYLLNNIDDIFPDRDRSISPEEWLATHKVFMVRKDMIKDIIGIRHPSISDAWSGVSRWSPKTQERIRNLAESIFGYNRAYKYLYNAELGTMKAVAFARNTIVIKSMSVAVDNMVANFYDLMLRGVPLTDIIRSIPDIYTQLDMYTRDKNALVQIEAQKVATSDPAVLEKLRIRENIINDRINNLNIGPLLKAGEFSTIADVGLTDEEVLFTSGKFTEAFNNALNSDRVPKMLSVPVKYFLVTKDTALYRTLEKSVSYGDFIGKAIYYKHLTQNRGMDETEAMRRVSDEFVNYDRLAGRNRIYLENIGLLWFYNFKLRMVKVHLDLLRNDPARILLNAINPLVLPTPMADSFLGKMLSGKLGYTIGPEMGLNSWRLLPFLQLFGHL